MGSSHASGAQHPCGTCLSGRQPVLAAGCHLFPHTGSLLLLLLLAVWIFAANSFAKGPLRRPVSAVRSGRLVALGWAAGWLPELSAICI